MSGSKILVLLLSCVVTLLAQQHPFNSNLAYLKPVYATCGDLLCSHESYPPSLITDGLEDTYWRSNTGPTSDYQLTLQLAQEYEVTELSISYPLLIPIQWSVEISRDNVNYQLLRFYSTDCLNNLDSACSLFNDSNGPQTFRIQVDNTQDSRAQFVRINLISLPTDAESDTQFYSVSEVTINGQCSCNGYGRSCLLLQDSSTLYECRCTGNTCGTYCEYCCEGYQNLEYVSRVNEPLFSCKRCDNCTNSLIDLLDYRTISFNSTAELFDALILTISAHSPFIDQFLDSFLQLYSRIGDYLFNTSAIELALYGNYTKYSIDGIVPVIQCPLIDISVVDWYQSVLALFYADALQLSQLAEVNNGTNLRVENHLQQLSEMSLSIEGFNATLQDELSKLATSFSQFMELANDVRSNFLRIKSELSTIISNHLFINGTLSDSTVLLSVATQWQNVIQSLFSSLTEFNRQADTLSTSLQSLSIEILSFQQFANDSLSLFIEIELSRDAILSILSETGDLTQNITVLIAELRLLNTSINSLFTYITEVLNFLEDCLERLTAYNNILVDRNAILESMIISVEVDLEEFLNTSVIQSADEYSLAAELYARNLISIYQEIILLARYAPDTTVILSLNEEQLRAAISNASNVVTERDRLNSLIALIRNDSIFSRISELKLLVTRLSEKANRLINESANILNTIKPYIDITNILEDVLDELRAQIERLYTQINIPIIDDEYNLSGFRTDLESRRTVLSTQEARVNSTIQDLIDAQTLLPDIAFYNNRTAMLRDKIVEESILAREEQFNISTGLIQLDWTTDNIKTRNSNIRSRLEKVYSRLSRVHSELQLPKAPLRLDGTTVVSLQPPPTEQLENATFSTDFSFYFEPVLTTTSQDTFLFFYAGPAILATSQDTSVLGSEDFISIVSSGGVMGYRARIGGTEFSKSLASSQTIRSNSKYVVRIKRVGSAFRFDLETSTDVYSTTPELSQESLHNFVFKPTPNTAYYIGGYPDDVLITDSLNDLGKFRGCVYLALTLRWNLYSLWDTRYHVGLPLGQPDGLDCIRHASIPDDFDVDGLSFNGYGHAYVGDLSGENSPQITFTITPQEHDGLILTAFGTNRGNKEFVFSFYLRDRKFHLDISYNGGDRMTFSSDLITKISTQYDIVLTVASRVRAVISYENQETTLSTTVTNNLYNSDVLLFGGISPLAVNQSSGALSGWTTDYYRNFTGCITHIFILRDSITGHILADDFNLNAGGTMGVSLGCPNFPIPEYSVSKTHDTGYLDFDLLVHEGVTGGFTQFYHGENNFELLPGPIGSLSTYPVDFSGSYSLGMIVSKPYFIGDKSVLVHLSDNDQDLVLEVSIDTTLNVTLEVTRGGVVESISSPLDLDKYRIMHSITVHSLGGSGLELYVDENDAVTLAGVFNLILPIELSEAQNLFVGGNETPEYSFIGCIKEVALYDSLLNLGLGTFVPTGTTSMDSEGIEHDLCGAHPYNGLIYGGSRALNHPFDFSEAVKNA